jgi:rubredoxin
MAKKSFIKINVRGGILSSGDLGALVEIIKKTGIEDVELGERQNIYFYVEKKQLSSIEESLKKVSLDYEIDKNKFPNIISSYAAEDIFSAHSWFGEGIYRDILYSFTYKPKIKINISDSTQALVPLYTGDLNFIPSSHVNFFHLFINHPALAGLKSWNRLVYVNDIAILAKEIEEVILKDEFSDIISLSEKIDSLHKLITIDANEPIQVPRLRFPYYEGMNKFGDKFWLGIYRRNNDFSISLLESIYNLCTQTRIGQINITPWKSIMIKGIVEEERIEWEKLLSRHGINSRHSSLELNWQLADLDQESIRIKNELVKSFDEEDIRTYGISFAIQTGKKMDLSSSVVIRKRPGIFSFWGFLKKLTMYDILYSPDFSLNAVNHRTYTSNITWNGLALNLRNLSQNYYKQLSEKTLQKKTVEREEKNKPEEDIHQCSHCLTLYIEKYGEPENDIPVGTSFELLPDNYQCPLCENPKADFIKIGTKKLVS